MAALSNSAGTNRFLAGRLDDEGAHTCGVCEALTYVCLALDLLTATLDSLVDCLDAAFSLTGDFFEVRRVALPLPVGDLFVVSELCLLLRLLSLLEATTTAVGLGSTDSTSAVRVAMVARAERADIDMVCSRRDGRNELALSNICMYSSVISRNFLAARQ